MSEIDTVDSGGFDWSAGDFVAVADRDDDVGIGAGPTGPDEFLDAAELGIEPRPYQREAVRRILGEFDAGRRSTLLVLPTGTGKTVVFGMVAKYVIEELGGRVLVLAHRGELLEQAQAKLDVLGVESVVEKAESCARRAIEDAANSVLTRDVRCVVGSVQTLHERRLARWPKDYFKLVVTDESHHSVADTYSRIYNHFSDAWHLGVTATADRLDAANLGRVYESKAYEYPLNVAIEEGYLCRLTAVKADVRVDLRGIRTVGGDFNQGDLEDRISAHLEPIVNATREKIGDRRTIVFTPDVGSAEAFASGLAQLKVEARSVSGKSKDREEILKGFAKGDFQVLCNCALLMEGYDNPPTSAIVLARPTKSRALLAQMVGRGTRIYPEKKDCIAEGQRVLTNRGLVPIENVTRDMKVWDGCDFVHHGGAVCRGRQRVIEYLGLVATPDHKVWTRQGWRTFDECRQEEDPITVTGIGGMPIRETEGYFRADRPRREGRPPADDRVRDLQGQGIEELRQRDGGEGRLSSLRESTERPSLALREGPGSPAALLQSEGFGLSPLRRPGDRVPLFVAPVDGPLGPTGTRTLQGYGTRPDRQRRALRAGESPVCHPVTEPVEHAETEDQRPVPSLPGGPSGDPIRRFDAPLHAEQGHDARGDHREVPHAVGETERRVWDILNAGPRHRFTVEGLLVSNCLIVDFDWQLDRHELVKPVELVIPKGTDRRNVEIAKELVESGEQPDLMMALEEADGVRRERDREAREEAERKRKLEIAVRERPTNMNWTQFDPVKTTAGVLGIRVSESFASRLVPATDRQVETLVKFKVPADEAKAMSRRTASKHIDILIDRANRGLASLSQVRCLERNGWAPDLAKAMTRAEASAEIDRLAQGWTNHKRGA